MKRSTLYFAAAAALFCAVSCARFDEAPAPAPVVPGGETPGNAVTAFLPLKPSSPEQTRAPFESEGMDISAISNVWVFQFGEAATDDQRLLVSPPYYIDESAIQDAVNDWLLKGEPTEYPHIPIPLIESAPGEVHLVAFAANINSKDFNWGMSAVEGQRSSYADLKKNVFLLDGESRSYGGDRKNLIMSGRVYSAVTPEIVLDENPDDPAAGGDNDEEGVPLSRSLARIQLNVSVDASVDFKVLSVQLRNIPRRIDVFDALIARDENLYVDHTLTYPKFPAELIDYDMIYNTADNAAGLVVQGGSENYVWYIPRNMRGQSSSSSAKTKSLLAPKGATYIEVVAAGPAPDREGLIYRIYPGLDDINDYTVLGNSEYNVTLNIKGDDGTLANDSRVERFGRVRLDGNNNCFILNPPVSAGIGPCTFEIPVTQVNRYWRQMWDGYGQLGEDILKAGDEWQVDLLWQDDAAMVRAASDAPTRIWLSKTSGTGGDDYFSVTVPYDAVNGNFVIALRKKEAGVVVDRVLWSWHMWVTGYNPDQHKMYFVDGRKFVYPVAGGQVERLGGPVWGNDAVIEGAAAAVNNNWHNYTYNPSSTAMYAKSFMMDRSVGALGTAYALNTTKGNIVYQPGRKDPIPSNIPLYNIAGGTIAAAATPGFAAQRWVALTANAIAAGDDPVKMSQSLADPMKFYNNSAWCEELVETRLYAWNDPLVPIIAEAADSYTGKSIYDPCPPGWKLPSYSTWEDFRQNNTYGWTVNNGGHNRGAGFGSFDKGIRYWPNIANQEGERPVEGVIFYPASGIRRYGTSTSSSQGKWYYQGTNGYFWTAMPSSTRAAFYLMYFTENNSYNQSYSSHACMARCVSMNE